MKKTLKTGKKVLSVFMAMLMVMTAWVFFAPTKASAAGGNYYVEIEWQVLNKGGTSNNEYTGKSSVTLSSDKNNCMGISLFYRTENGRGAQGEVYWDIGHAANNNNYKGQASGSGATVIASTGWTDSNTGTTYKCAATVPGFPTEVFAICDYAAATQSCWTIKKITVASSSSSAAKTTLWEGTTHLTSSWNQYYVTIGATGVMSPHNLTENTTSVSHCESEGTFSHRENQYYETSVAWETNFPYVPSNRTISSATAVANIGIPPLGDEKDVKISTRSPQYYTTDQYGVRYEPTSYSVSGVTTLTTGTNWSVGKAYPITATTSTTKSDTATYQTATLTCNWNNANYKGTETQHSNSTNTFRVYNPRYAITFNGNSGTLGTKQTYAYYNQAVNATTSSATSNNVAGLTAEKFPTTGNREGYTFNGLWSSATGGTEKKATDKVTAASTWYAHWNVNQYTATFFGKKSNDAGSAEVEYELGKSTVNFNTKPVAPEVPDYDYGDYHYTFASWDKEITNIGINGAEYRATYTPIFVKANYTDVDKAIEEAEAVQNSDGYDGIYSEESRANLQRAIDAVVRDKGRTQQSDVDAYAKAIRDAIEALGRQKYSVVFINSRDNSIIGMQYPVYYGDSIVMPEDPAITFDTSNHYEFKGWESSEEGDDISFVSKNMVILANFETSSHTYKTKELPSNCTTQSGIEYTCDCGYSYVEYSGSLGSEHDVSTEWTIDIEPTCTTPGQKSHHCTRCSYREDVTPIDALNHDYTGIDYTVIIEAGCENDGVEIRECARCGYNDYHVLDASNHDYTDGVSVVAPTCTSYGYTEKTCNNCHETVRTDYTQAIDHNFVKDDDESTTATCTGVGRTVSYCSECKLQKVEVIAPNGHEWGADEQVSATCTTNGYTKKECTVCHAIEIDEDSFTDLADHNFVENPDEYVAPTCTGLGQRVSYCECGESKVETIKATGHKNIKEIVTAPTCLVGGTTAYVCEDCGVTVETTTQSALGHDDSVIKTVEPTCTEKGKTIISCSRCGRVASEVVDESKTPTGHNFNEADDKSNVEIVKEATCTENGVKHVYCLNGCDEFKDIAIEKSGHDWVLDTDTSKTYAATCETDGNNHYICLNGCTETKDEKLDALGHDMVEVAEGTTKATCTTAGNSHKVCANGCGKEENEVIPVNPEAHEYDDGKLVQTCYSASYILYTCKHDATHTKKEYTDDPLLEHNLKITINGDEINVKCQNDGCPIDETFVAEIAHNFVVDKVVNATCQEDGYIYLVCDAHENCGKTQTVTIPKNGAAAHTDLRSRSSGICGKDGLVEIYCADCGKVVNSWKPKDHEWHEKTVVEKTCTQNGYDEYHCKYCPAVYKDNYKMATGHKYPAEGVYEEATCTTPARWVYKCELCTNGHVNQNNCDCDHGIDYIKYVIDQNSAPKGHVWGDWQYEDHGTFFYKYRECTVCKFKEYVIDENQNKVPYYQVQFVNPWATVDYTQAKSDHAKALDKLNSDKALEISDTYNACNQEIAKVQKEYGTMLDKADKNDEALINRIKADYQNALADVNKKYDDERTAINAKYAAAVAKENNRYDAVTAKINKQYDVLNGGLTYLVKKDVAYDSEVVGTAYVTKGGSVEYIGNRPVRARDYNIGAYIFNGWSATKGGAKIDKNNVIDNITANTIVYAVFAEEKVQHTVQFFNQTANGQLLAPITYAQTYDYGTPARYLRDENGITTDPWNIPENMKPTMPSTLTNNFKFKHWSWEGGNGAEYDTEHIYDDVNLIAVYDAIGKQYKIVFHDKSIDNSTLNDSVVYERTFSYGDSEADIASRSYADAKAEIDKVLDNEYETVEGLYSFEGWKLSNGTAINFTYGDLRAPDATWAEYEYKGAAVTGDEAKDKQNGIIHVYPTYYMRPITYVLEVFAIDVGNVGVPVGSLVEVFDSHGQRVAAKGIDAESKCQFNLTSGMYRVVVHSGDDAGFSGDKEDYFFAVTEDTQITVQVHASKDINDGKEHCSCICHSFLSRIWITFLNLIYRLFGKKTVCCYDMYATHGDRLVYANPNN